MKKVVKKTAIIGLVVLTAGSALAALRNITDTTKDVTQAIKQEVEPIIETVKEGVTTATETVERAVQPVLRSVEGAVTTVTQHVGSATDLVREQVFSKEAFESFKTRMESCAKTAGYGTAWAAAIGSLEAAKLSLEIAKKAAPAAGVMVNYLKDKNIKMSQAINLEYFYFETNLVDIKQGTLPQVKIDGVFFGRRITTTMQLRIQDAPTMSKQLFNKIVKKIT